MQFKSFPEFISAASDVGEVVKLNGADLNLEVGALTEIMAEQQGPLLLFDNFKNYPQGFRVATNVLIKPSRFALALGLPTNLHPIELIKLWRKKLQGLQYIAPVTVTHGRIQENVITGKDVDISRIPAPKWHENDGGHYIGTGDMVIVKDPDTGWVNLGTYRCCVQGTSEVSLWIIKSKHGRMIAEKYWKRGEDCPVAIVLGADPVTYISSGMSMPEGVSEYAYAGALHGAPVEVVETPRWRLPVPAGAEIVVEGVIPNPEKKSVHEGPFGEWPGYYSHQGQECVVEIQTIMHANNPILYGAPPLRPVSGIGSTLGIPSFTSTLWDHLERSGVTDVQGVWGFCNSLMVVISLKQRYAGHAKQALLAASGLRASASMYRYYVVVDEDIDPSNKDEVLWALCTRVDPTTSVDVIRGVWTSALDPRLSPALQEAGDFTMGRMLIDACKPFHWRNQFPQTNRFSSEKRKETATKWKHIIDHLNFDWSKL